MPVPILPDVVGPAVIVGPSVPPGGVGCRVGTEGDGDTEEDNDDGADVGVSARPVPAAVGIGVPVGESVVPPLALGAGVVAGDVEGTGVPGAVGNVVPSLAG